MGRGALIKHWEDSGHLGQVPDVKEWDQPQYVSPLYVKWLSLMNSILFYIEVIVCCNCLTISGCSSYICPFNSHVTGYIWFRFSQRFFSWIKEFVFILKNYFNHGIVPIFNPKENSNSFKIIN